MLRLISFGALNAIALGGKFVFLTFAARYLSSAGLS